MSDFQEEIRKRKKHEDELLSEAFQSISQAVAHHKIGDGIYEEGRDVKDALSQLLRYFDIKEKEVPKQLETLEEKLDFLLSSTGIFYREVQLEPSWFMDGMGVMMTTLKEDGSVITVVPGGAGGFVYVNPHTGKKKWVTKKESELMGLEAYLFYRPLPMRKLRPWDIWRYMKDCLTFWDLFSFGNAALIITLIGLLIPKLNNLLTGTVISAHSQRLLIAVMVFMVSVTIGNAIFTSIKQLLITRIGTKLKNNIVSATMMRVLSLPTDFFKNYSTGELNQYLSNMSNICDTVVNGIFSTGITGLFSLVFLIQVFSFAKALVIPSIVVTLLTLFVSMFTATTQMVISREQMEIQAKEKGIVYSLITGIRKIRLAGAEKRAFANWANYYAKEAELQYDPPAQIKLNSVVTTAISLGGTVFIYFTAVKSGVSVADYYAFNSAYAYISSAFTALASTATTIATIRPGLELIRPLLEAEPESDEELETITDLSGNIEISHLFFQYSKDSPMVLKDLSLMIPSGQYVAIVGKTGCGKSTLLRLLLGFETPTKGSILYDEKDTHGLDMHSVRKKIGTVMQDGKLFQGSIFENIIIADPTLSMEDAWEAAKIAGIDEDIERMPMKMHTMISGMGGGISGGQKQRLMIARAIAPKPKILFLDEATSALDNITQKHVSDSLDKLNCTRVVIAHRLSTIRHCDRILVLDQGRIIEDGTYDELMEEKGFFAQLVERQRV